MNEPISRFTGKAQAYASGRPIYPPETLRQILEVTQLPKTATVYDLGAGTGLFAQLLLTHFDHVNLVEPNPDMRATATQRLPQDQCTIISAQAEAFPAETNCIDLITAAQAFHWFDQTVAKRHWQKVLKPDGHIALIWNERIPSTPFAKDVTDLLQTLAQRDPLKPPPTEQPDEEIVAFFASAQLFETEHVTPLTKQELTDLVLSRSYSPLPTDPGYSTVVAQIDSIFEAHQISGKVNLPYNTKLFLGQI